MSRVRTALWWSRAPAAASGGGASARVARRTSAAMNGARRNGARGGCAGIVVPIDGPLATLTAKYRAQFYWIEVVEVFERLTHCGLTIIACNFNQALVDVQTWRGSAPCRGMERAPGEASPAGRVLG